MSLIEGNQKAKNIHGDGVITGFGRIGGRLVFVYVYDFTILGGSLGEMAGRKVVKLMEHALKVGDPSNWYNRFRRCKNPRRD